MRGMDRNCMAPGCENCTVGKDVMVGSWIARGTFCFPSEPSPSNSSRGFLLVGWSSSGMGSQITLQGRSRANASVDDEERMVAGKNLRGVAVNDDGWGREGLAGREWEEEI